MLFHVASSHEFCVAAFIFLKGGTRMNFKTVLEEVKSRRLFVCLCILLRSR